MQVTFFSGISGEPPAPAPPALRATLRWHSNDHEEATIFSSDFFRMFFFMMLCLQNPTKNTSHAGGERGRAFVLSCEQSSIIFAVDVADESR